MQRKSVRHSGLLICLILFNLVSCIKNDRFTPSSQAGNCNGQPGPLFQSVKTIITQNCVSCHNNYDLNGNMNWTVDCNIVQFRDRIKARAVDEKTMPPTGPLSQADRDKISAWINAGGSITN